MADKSKISDIEAKAAMLEWIIDLLCSGDNVSEKKLDAFRMWLAEDSRSEVKIEGLRRAIDIRSGLAYSQQQADSRSEEARQGWRKLAPRLDMDPELNNYRKMRQKSADAAGRRYAATPLSKPPKAPDWRKYVLMAAAVLAPILMLAGGYLLLRSRRNISEDQPVVAVAAYEPTQSVSTAADSVRYVTLVDGTEVMLNRDSDFSWNENRECFLSGEAYFKVAKESTGKPFVIHSGHLEVTVLGTEFNFSTSATAGNSTLSLYEGTVQLEHASGTHLLEEAGKEFHLDHATGEVIVDDFDMTVEPAWVAWENLYKYHSLGTIFHAIESTYGMRFENMDSIDTTQHISFRLHEDKPVEAVMEVLETASGDFTYKINGDTIVLQPRK